ncbi:MAG: AEC family transporter [Gammaproteobacteria bacterium]|nr:AEC family transporter [Gammaproteobacteria bacterium]
MIEIITAIGTVFILILLGSLLRIKTIPSDEYWLYADKLVYWILFPSFLFYKTSTITLTAELLGPISQTLLAGMFLSVIFAWSVSHWKNIESAPCSSVVQGAGRHNTFIALAVAESLFGEKGLMIATLSTAILVPVTNLVIVVALVIILNKGQQQMVRKISGDLLRNPLLISIFMGFVANLTGFKYIPVIHDATGLLGSATLPIVLLCIGASIQFAGLKQTLKPLLVSSIAKFIIFPGVVFSIVLLAEVPPEIAIILIIYAATPTAASGFALARQMGGDYKLMASIISNQTLASFITLPLTIYLAMKYLGLE